MKFSDRIRQLIVTILLMGTGIHQAHAVQVYIVSHGWHTGLVVPADTISDRLPQLKTRFPDAGYIEFGWGDHSFYKAKEITLGLALHSILLPTDSVMHTVALPVTPDRYFIGSEVKSLCLDSLTYSRLLDHIVTGFRLDDDGQIETLDKGIYGDSQFYTGHGDYHLFNTCNKWTAQGLAAAGLDISPAFIFRAESVMTSIDGAHARGLPSDCPEYRNQHEPTDQFEQTRQLNDEQQ